MTIWGDKLHQDVGLGAVFLPLYLHTRRVGGTFSVAELDISAEDLEWLTDWLRSQEPEDIYHWSHSDLRYAVYEDFPDLRFSRAEMLGSLILVSGALHWRDESPSDGVVWPVFAKTFRGTPLRHTLFLQSGYPNSLCRSILVSGTELLGIRNVYGLMEQDYATSVKLQSAFSLKGAKKHLAEWLVGMGKLVAIRLLLGELAPSSGWQSSRSFQDLWEALRQYRSYPAPGSNAETVIRNSPWIPEHWLEEILESATEIVYHPETGEKVTGLLETEAGWLDNLGEGDVTLAFDDVVTGISTCDEDGALEVVLGLNKETLSLIAESLENEWKIGLLIDGERVGRMMKFGDHWSIPSSVTLKTCTPKLLSLVQSTGETLLDVSLEPLGFDSEVVIIDTALGRMLDPFEAKLSTNKQYVLIIKSGLELLPTMPASHAIGDRRAHILDQGWSEETIVTQDGVEVWQPILRDSQQSLPIVGEISGCGKKKPRPLTSRDPLCLRIICDLDLTVDQVMVWHDGKPIEASPMGEAQWELEPPDAEAMNREAFHSSTLFRVRVRLPNGWRSIKVRQRIPFIGVATYSPEANGGAQSQWKPLRHSETLYYGNTGSGLKVFGGISQDEDTVLFEGPRPVLRIRGGKVSSADLHGWGAPLILQRIRSRESHTIVSRVEHRGEVLIAGPGREDTEGLWMVLRNPIEPSDQHQLVVWHVNENGVPEQEPRWYSPADGEVSIGHENRTWSLATPSSAWAAAISFRGRRLGSWIANSRLKSLIEGLLSYECDAENRRERLRQAFAILGWLRAPVLSRDIRELLRLVINEDPIAFLEAFAEGRGLPEGLQHTQGFGISDPAIRRVIRSFLLRWPKDTEFDPNVVAKSLSVLRRDGGSRISAMGSFLLAVAEFSPGLIPQFFATSGMGMIGPCMEVIDRYRDHLGYKQAEVPFEARLEGQIRTFQEQHAQESFRSPEEVASCCSLFWDHAAHGKSLFPSDQMEIERLLESPKGIRALSTCIFMNAMKGDT